MRRRRTNCGIPFAFCVAVVFATLVRGGAEESSGEDWPCFLGPRQDGTSLETGILKVWPEKGPPVVWARRVGNAYSAPVTSRGRTVIFHRVKDEEIIECLKSATGETIWKFPYPTHYEDRYGYNNGPRSSATIDGDRVYSYGAEGVLTCLEFETGKLVWQRPLNKDFGVPQGFFGAGTAPVLDGGLILINVGATNGAGIVGLKKQTGETVWKTGNDEAGYSTPIVRTVQGKRLGLFLTRDAFVGVETATGKEIYRFPFRSKTYESVNAATPVLVDDAVFLSATYGVGSAELKLEPDGFKVLWQSKTAMQNHWATSVYRGGFLYGMDGRHEAGSNFRCIDFKTGDVKWTADQGLGRASFVMVEGHLIAIGERGDLALIEVNPERYIEKARVRVLQYPCWIPPVLSHGLLYLRNENTLACLDLRERK